MLPSLARALPLALGFSAAIGGVSGQLPEKTPFASLVLAAQEQRVAQPTPTIAQRAGFDRRQISTQSPTTTVVTVAPDSTCGFLSGSPGNAITCENGGICSWAPDFVSAVICADYRRSIPFSAKLRCYERTAATNTNICDDVCQSNEFNLLCTETSLAFCRTYNYPSGLVDFRCASTAVASAQSIEFTYSGQEGRDFFTTTWSDESSSFIISSTTRPSSSVSGSSTSTESSSRTSSSASETTTTTPDPAPGPGTNVGAIVGGVVGGVALLALIGFGIYFMRRHSAKKDAQMSAQNMAAAPGPHTSMPPPGQQPMQQPYYPPPGASPYAPTDSYGWKPGAGSPVHAVTPMGGAPPYDAHTTSPMSGAPYDNATVSDIQSTRGSQVYSPGPGQPIQPTNQPPTIQEVGTSNAGHHRGNLHEIG